MIVRWLEIAYEYNGGRYRTADSGVDGHSIEVDDWLNFARSSGVEDLI